jgi:plastocyanin
MIVSQGARIARAIFFASVSLAAGSQAFAECDPSEPLVITIKNMKFDPRDAVACAGQTIRWVNAESNAAMVHTVTADPALAKLPDSAALPEGAEPFDSGQIKPGESFEQVLTVAGDYRYFCKPHERMGHKGTISVVE